MNARYLLTLIAALSLGLNAASAVSAPAQKPGQARDDAPVAQPETDPAVSNSGNLVPGQPIRPEADDEASVPKTPMDKSAASSADVGANKNNTKQNRSSSGSDTGRDGTASRKPH